MKFQVTKNGKQVNNVVQLNCPRNLYGRSVIALAQAMYEIYKINPCKCWQSFGEGILKKGTIQDDKIIIKNVTYNRITINDKEYGFEPKPNKDMADASDNYPRIWREKKATKDEPFYCIAIEGNTIILASTSDNKYSDEIENSSKKEFKFSFSDGTSTGVAIEMLDENIDKNTQVSVNHNTPKKQSNSKSRTTTSTTITCNSCLFDELFNKENKNMQNYIDFCEQLFQKWYSAKGVLHDFEDDFQIDYLPEPYFTAQNGNNPLFVLNNNPGHGIPKQLWENIHKNNGIKHYIDAAEMMADYYWSDEFKSKEPNAFARMVKMLDFAKGIEKNGVINIETFFLHSPSLIKSVFINKYIKDKNEMVLQYTQLLKAYLSDKSVLAIASIGSRSSIDKNVLKSNDWVVFLCKIMGLNIDDANIIPITKSDKGKISSCIVVDKNKYMAISMGNNNLPKISKEIYQKIK